MIDNILEKKIDFIQILKTPTEFDVNNENNLNIKIKKNNYVCIDEINYTIDDSILDFIFDVINHAYNKFYPMYTVKKDIATYDNMHFFLILGNDEKENMIDCASLDLKTIEILNDFIEDLTKYIKKYGTVKVNEVNLYQDKIDEQQKILEKLFQRNMTQEELDKLNQLGLNEEISKLVSPYFHINYFNNIGYIFISEGKIFLENDIEQKHYFCNIFKDSEEAKVEILKRLNK